jgi:hypothetical protein
MLQRRILPRSSGLTVLGVLGKGPRKAASLNGINPKENCFVKIWKELFIDGAEAAGMRRLVAA